MGLIFPNVLLDILYLILVAFFVLYKFLTKHYDYWEKRGVPYKKAKFPFGSMKDALLTKTTVAIGHDEIYKQFPKERYYGMVDFIKPVLVVKDLDLIKNILIKDFDSFSSKDTTLINPKEYITKHLANLQGREWKIMRTKLTPTFTSGKLKMMFPLMEKCSEQLNYCLVRDIKDGAVVDAKNILSRFTMDMIASCFFGLESDALPDENSEFYRILGNLMKLSRVAYLFRIIFTYFPILAGILRIRVVTPEVTAFVHNVLCDTIDYRMLNNVQRNDFLDLLININQNSNTLNKLPSDSDQKRNSSDGLTLEQIIAQTFLFLMAGYETSSSLMSFCLYEIARHQEVQETLYQQLQKAVDLNEGKFSYQLLTDVPYLDQVLKETLRLYGVTQALQRICTMPYKIPDSNLFIEKGVKVVIPIYSIHRDPQFYPDPDEFKPERFSPEETKKRHSSTFLAFGDGPRHCIGMRVALLQAKVGIATVVLNFHVDLSPDQEVPIEIHTRAVPITPANPVLLKLKKRKEI